ncbi:MAG: DUF4224 domain-containing protein [Gammaproteobacteria bacterium]|nr:DUF4224 domain-containing protein [Gammaproteobacteria bacterium]
MIFDIYEQRDLFKIAGCRRQRRLVDWLIENHIPYKRNARGEVIAHRNAVEAGFGVTVATKTDDVELWLGGGNVA